MSVLLSSFFSYEASCKLRFDDRCCYCCCFTSKQARWDHKPVNFFALSFTTQVTLGWENSSCVVFFFLPLLLLFLLLLKTHMLLSSSSGQLWQNSKTRNKNTHTHKYTKPEKRHKVKAAAAAGTTTTTTLFY